MDPDVFEVLEEMLFEEQAQAARLAAADEDEDPDDLDLNAELADLDRT